MLVLVNFTRSKLEYQQGKKYADYLQTAEDIEITLEDLALSACN